MLKADARKHSDEFKKSFGLSLAVHLVIIALFSAKLMLFSKPYIDLSQSISVDIGSMTENNSLPPKISESSEPVDETPEPVSVKQQKTQTQPTEPKLETVNLAKSKSRQKEALNKLKKMSALEKIKQDLKSDSIARIKAVTKTPSKPRALPAGSALGGLDKLQANSYLQSVDKTIKQFWTLPQWLLHKPFKAQVLVKFNADGKLLANSILTTSGNSSYDQYCLHAIEKAAPFPKVPDKLTEKFSIDGIVVGFPE